MFLLLAIAIALFSLLIFKKKSTLYSICLIVVSVSLLQLYLFYYTDIFADNLLLINLALRLALVIRVLLTKALSFCIRSFYFSSYS